MQKRARGIETQKLRRTIKARSKTTDSVANSVSVSLAYMRLAALWLLIIALDMFVGFRFELLWPFWLVLRAGYEAIHKNHNPVATLANNSSAKFSVLFVCVTATSDLICYLFIPVRVLIFIASTYVWVHLLWQTHGGFVRTISTAIADRSQAVPIVLIWSFIILFEFSCRIRCDFLILAKDGAPFANYFNLQYGCSQVQGLSPLIPRSLNSFFGAHCIGYPLVIVSFSLRYYFKEWCIRRKQDSVSRQNEVLHKLLVEAIPAVYEGPNHYAAKSCVEPEELEVLSSSALEVSPLPIAPTLNGTKRPVTKPARQRSARSTKLLSSPNSQKAAGSKRDEDLEDSDGSDEWRESSGSVSLISLVFDAFRWLTSWVSGSSEGSEDDDVDSLCDDNFKKTCRNGDAIKVRASVRKGREVRPNAKEKMSPLHDKINGSSSHTNGKCELALSSNGESQQVTAARHDEDDSFSLEVDRLRSELSQSKADEADVRLQLSMKENSEKLCRQEAAQLRSKLEQSESRYATMERLRDMERSTVQQLEKKCADLMNRKNDIERELMAERKARKNADNDRKSDMNEEQRTLERDIERLRTEAAAREQHVNALQKELQSLRQYKEENDVAAMSMELRVCREKMLHLDEALAAENKLKQELFRALGDAKANNAVLENKLKQKAGEVTQNETARNVAADKASQLYPPSYHVVVQQPKCDAMQDYLYTALQQHHCSPTGEHVLFDQPQTAITCSMPMSSLEHMGKFGAPTNPTRSN